MGGVVRTEFERDIAVVIIDHPPINAGSRDVRLGLVAAIEALRNDADISGIVLIGAGSTFIAGSDLREFGLPLAEPQLPAVIGAIESCGKPVVAALHGAALGGGLELALGCDARLALAGTVMGLPEVTLGIIPGAGGTQRLPRLTGIAQAISLVCSGERVSAAKALSLGLIDLVVAEDLRTTAVILAEQLTAKSRIRDRSVPHSDPISIARAKEGALRAGKGRPAVFAAIECIEAAASLAFDAGLAQERARFESLRSSREARALRHQFFSEREAAKHPAAAGGKSRSMSQLAIVGAGTMGTGIAIAALDAGFNVVLLEQDGVALDRGMAVIRDHYARRVKSGKVLAAVAEERQRRVLAGADWSVAADADLFIEAVFEDLTVKRDVFRRLDELAKPGAILASNTSYVDLDQIAAVVSRPQSVIGLHFFAPAHVMRLLEIVRGSVTSPDVVATALKFAKDLRKISVISANAFGFIGNRVYAGYRRQCEFMLEEGASPRQIDSALEAFGFAMGPFATGDLSGLDIAWRMRRSLAAVRDPHARYVAIPDLLCEAGRLGRKTGAGYYSYDPAGGGGPWKDDPAVETIISHARAAKGIEARAFTDSEITRRALLSMVNEAALLLAEGVAHRAGDIDVVAVNGYGFPKWEGGPVFWAGDRDAETLAADLAWLADSSGPGFVRGDVRRLSPSPADVHAQAGS